MQQGGGGGGGGGGGHGHQSQYGEMGVQATGGESSSKEEIVEAASPISSRPPAAAPGNLDEFMRLASGGDEGYPPGGGGEGGGFATGNRWPRQETLALLQIRSDMDAVFRDATVKGPLWEDVSRKLEELGYKRSAKKCREKFENVHKYYKRTKEGRAGRQDGKSYKFFTQLEAFHTTNSTAATNLSTPPAAAATLDVAPVSVGIPMPISSSVRISPTTATTIPMSSMLPTPESAPAPGPVPVPPSAPPFGISFSSNCSSSSQGFDIDDDEDELGAREASNMAGTSRKRKRLSSSSTGGIGGSSSSSSSRRMMDFLEGLMKQVMRKQEAMQQRFLEAIEKREQDRMIREEAWKRQELARLAREHEVMAQERTVAASRNDAIISFLQKITGQTIQLPKTVTVIPAAPPLPHPPSQPVVRPAAAPPLHQPPSFPPQQQPRSSQRQQQPQFVQSISNSEVVMAVPEHQVPPPEIGGSGSLEPSSSRWPKAEVLTLINLRSGLESRYQEVGPKGPLWEDVSAGMLKMGYKRSAKRCKEKWENINKYFKKVKESSKKRPEDAKTCPYFHQLDALYRNKTLGGGGTSGGSGSFSDQNIRPELEEMSPPPTTALAPPQLTTQPTDDQPGNNNEDSGASKKPEDIVRELMEEQGMQQRQHQLGQSLLVDGYGKIDELRDSDDMYQDEDTEDDDDGDDELEQGRKMGYKIEFQRPNASNPNGGGNGASATSFMAMVQ